MTNLYSEDYESQKMILIRCNPRLEFSDYISSAMH